MALTNAERQKRYREKQKEENKEEYLKKEAKRKRNAYIPSSKLSPSELMERRAVSRMKFKKHYYKVKQATNDKIQPQPSTSSGTLNGPLIVQLPYMKKNNFRKTYRRSLMKAYRSNKELVEKNVSLEKKNKALQKRIERLRKKEAAGLRSSEEDDADASSMETEDSIIEMTPRSKTRAELGSLKLDRKRAAAVKKKLLLSNLILHSITPKLKSKKRSDDPVILSRSFSEYRCISTLSKATGIHRKKLRNAHLKRKAKLMSAKYRDQVHTFLERTDNSTTMPGKKDTKTVLKEVKQKHVLNDYMLNLYEKFKLENPEITISKTCFYRLRPPHIILADFANRRTCLCTRHQNMSLKIKALNNLGIRISKNPDVLIKAYNSNKELLKMIEAVEERSIKFFNWKRVQEGNKMRYKELEENMEKKAFIEKFDRELNDFREHAKRVTNQYNEMRRLREHLPENEVVVWMDFAENYGCVSLEEIQSAYWNATSISLHTMVVYSKAGNDTKIQSYVAVSDVLSHNSTAVYTILKKLVNVLKTGNPDLRVIHYLSDSPTSQYRNKTMFQFVSMHEEEFGIPARWSFLESGHGKGPCDGLGASVKRAADNAVKQGKVSIQSASDFLKWAESSMTSGSKVKYFGYTQEEYELSEAVLKERLNPVPVKGTFKIHYIIGSGTNKIYTRNSTCYCEKCRSDISSTTCEGYEFHVLVKGRDNNEAVDEEMIPDAQDVNNGEGEASEATYGVDSWVAVLYSKKWYIGNIKEVDEEDGELFVHFMAQCGKYSENCFKWPNDKDELWVKPKDIIYVLPNPPQPSVKTGRIFKIPEEQVTTIENMCKK